MVLNRFIHACIPGIWTAIDHVVCGCLNPSIRGTGGEHRTGGRSPENPGGGGCLGAAAPKQAATPAEAAQAKDTQQVEGGINPFPPLSHNRLLPHMYFYGVAWRGVWLSGSRVTVSGPLGESRLPDPLRPLSPARATLASGHGFRAGCPGHGYRATAQVSGTGLTGLRPRRHHTPAPRLPGASLCMGTVSAPCIGV